MYNAQKLDLFFLSSSSQLISLRISQSLEPLITSLQRAWASSKLITFRIAVRYRNRDKTDVTFDVLVLELEGMLPNISADGGVMGQGWVLVGGGDNFERLCRIVVALKRYISDVNKSKNMNYGTYEPAPSISFISSSDGIELLEIVNTSKSVQKGILKRQSGDMSSRSLGRRKILPE